MPDREMPIGQKFSTSVISASLAKRVVKLSLDKDVNDIMSSITKGITMKQENGFTLLELLVVMALSGIVMASLYATFLSQQRSYQMTEQVVAVQQNLRGAMYYMERDIRIAGYDPKRTNDFGVTAISAQSITVTMDTGKADGTGKDDGIMKFEHGETITYAYNAGENTITRDPNDSSGAQRIAENVTGLTFTGLTATGATTTAGANVRSVDITITGSLGGHTRTYTTRVRCRNMGL